MSSTLTYVLSSDTLAAGPAGVNIYNNGPTTLVLSFSGVNVNATYLKFITKLPGELNERIIQSSGALSDVRFESVTSTFYPQDKHTTSYSIGITGVKNNLQLDSYQVNLNIGKSSVTNYKDLKIVNSHLFTNQTGKDNLLLFVEGQKQRRVSNVLIPFNKNKIVYVGTPQRIVYSAAISLRLEARSYNGSFMPVATEVSRARIVREDQLIHYVLGADIGETRDPNNAVYGESAIVLMYNNGIPRVPDINGELVEEFLIHVPEGGIDYIYDIIPDNLPNTTHEGVSPVE